MGVRCKDGVVIGADSAGTSGTPNFQIMKLARLPVICCAPSSPPVITIPPTLLRSFDFPVSLYRSMKIRLAEDGVSMRDYVIGLIEDDLNSR